MTIPNLRDRHGSVVETSHRVTFDKVTASRNQRFSGFCSLLHLSCGLFRSVKVIKGYF